MDYCLDCEFIGMSEQSTVYLTSNRQKRMNQVPSIIIEPSEYLTLLDSSYAINCNFNQ